MRIKGAREALKDGFETGGGIFTSTSLFTFIKQ